MYSVEMRLTDHQSPDRGEVLVCSSNITTESIKAEILLVNPFYICYYI